jgi:hypothetical protein
MRSVSHFTDPSLSFVDETQPGWTASAENVNKLKEKLKTIAANSAGIVFDILGNSSVRYEQFDGTLPCPSGTMDDFTSAVKLLQHRGIFSKRLLKM